MKEIWVLNDGVAVDELEFYDCKETAQLAYNKWCELNNETPDEKVFNYSYRPLSKMFEVITAEKVASSDYIPK